MSNNRMAKLFEENASSIGVHIDNDLDVVLKYGGATDMGNVSRIVPSIHPKYYIGTKICNHNEGFTTASGKSILLKILSYFVFNTRSSSISSLICLILVKHTRYGFYQVYTQLVE